MSESTVLCVDDEPPVLNSLRRDLGRRGFRVATAGSAAEARQVLAGQTVDAVVADLRLPGEDGIGLLAELAAARPAIVRVLLTAAGDYRASTRAINEGHVFAYLEKPWDADALAHTLRAGLEANAAADPGAALAAEHTDTQHRALSEDAWRLLRGLEVMEAPEKAGHGRRVAELITAFCRHIGIGEARVQEAQAAALVHDLGEAPLPEAARQTPERLLSGQDLRAFQGHPETGAALLRGLEGMASAAEIVAAHHERHDGKGFPRGLAGDEIPAAVRIFAVVDTYDELLTGVRGARRLSPAEARDALQRQSGTRFDPRAVRAFVRWAVQTETAEPAPDGLPLEQLRPGMVLAEDLTTPDGLLLVPAGHRLTEALLARISALATNLPQLRARVRR